MQLFYNPDIAAQDKTATFPKDESKHIVKVLRKKAGDILDITNGSGNFFKAEITSASPSGCTVRILEVTQENALPYKLHMAVAPTKLNDRYEWFLEKATEIGITEITPVICDHSERKVIKEDRYERILQSAMKQSLKAYLPKLNLIVGFNDFIKGNHSVEAKSIGFLGTGKSMPITDIHKNKNSHIVCIGPEGDFSIEEVELAKENGLFVILTRD